MSSFSRLLPVALEFSPGVVRPLTKVGPRKEILTRLKRNHTEILTGTPVKQQLMVEKEINSRKGKFTNTSTSKKNLKKSDAIVLFFYACLKFVVSLIFVCFL